MSEKQLGVVSVEGRAAEAVIAKRAAETLLKKLDQPRLRGGRHLVVNTADGELKVWRDNTKQRVLIEHPRVGQQSVRVSVRGVYVSSGSNIRDMEAFLELNPLTLSYFSLLQ